eukprot:12400052-Karenia_brevis.AAC.1
MCHAVQCFVRLVKVLLGKGAIAPRKVDYGTTLCILGVELRFSDKGFTTKPAPHKVVKWIRDIESALRKRSLSSGQASKLAGRLMWGASHLFRRLGRAMLRAIFDQCSRLDGWLSPELEACLIWWLQILNSGVAQALPWEPKITPPTHMFCDAASQPPHLGCVLFTRGRCRWCHMPVPKKVMQYFCARRDNQIMGLELLAISMGLSTFA